MDQSAQQVPSSRKNRLARLAGRIISVISALGLIATCIYLLIKGKPNEAGWPAVGAGVLGYVILRPGKRSARVTMGGVVLDIISDDTGVLRTGVGAVMTSISHEISERTVQDAIKGAEKGTPPLPKG